MRRLPAGHCRCQPRKAENSTLPSGTLTDSSSGFDLPLEPSMSSSSALSSATLPTRRCDYREIDSHWRGPRQDGSSSYGGVVLAKLRFPRALKVLPLYPERWNGRAKSGLTGVQAGVLWRAVQKGGLVVIYDKNSRLWFYTATGRAKLSNVS